MGTPFLLSRKIRHSILEGVELLRFGPFTERDVKVLLIDLREVAKYMKNVFKDDSSEFAATFQEFIEVCDFIAHASRDRGLVERIVREHVKKLHAGINLSQTEFLRIPVDRVLNANKFSLSLAVISSFASGRISHEHNAGDVKELHDRQSEIALCVLSLLQDSFISLNKDEGFGVLQLMPHAGKYRLYCRVMNSKIEREAGDRTGRKGNLSLGFPVIVSDAKCLDEAVLSYDHETFPHPILETFRDPSSTLRVRILECDGDAY